MADSPATPNHRDIVAVNYTINGITPQRGKIDEKTANYDIFFRVFPRVSACFRGYLPLNYHWRLWRFPLDDRQAIPRLPGVAASVWQYLTAVGPGFAPVAVERAAVLDLDDVPQASAPAVPGFAPVAI